jgi:hypothetical protein
MGRFYEEGLGVAKDYQKSYSWYKEAADQDLADAQYTMGRFYEEGLGVAKDYQKSFLFYKKAGEKGHKDSIFKLGDFYIKGLLIKFDEEVRADISISRKNEKEKKKLENEYQKINNQLQAYIKEEQLRNDIEENIVIREEAQCISNKKIILNNKKIFILGGKWDSKNKEEVEDFFWNNGCSKVIFLKADRLIRNEDKIKNADIIIFDTSVNSHSMYYKYRNHISYTICKSNLNVIEGLFDYKY